MSKLFLHSDHIAEIQASIERITANFQAWFHANRFLLSVQLVTATSLFLWYLMKFGTADQPDKYATHEDDHHSHSHSTTTEPSIGKMADQAVAQVAAEPAPPATPQLNPPKDDAITKQELSKYDGQHAEVDNKIYVAIKGTVFDVSHKMDMYGPGKGYHIFTAKDASVALGKSSLKIEDAKSDFSELDDEEKKVLDDWFKYFQKRYNIVGKVVD